MFASAKLVIIDSGNGLSPVRHQSITKANPHIFLIWVLGMLTCVLEKVQNVADVINRWTDWGHLLIHLNKVNVVAHDFRDFWDRLHVFPLNCHGLLYNFTGSRRCVLMIWPGGHFLDLGDGEKVIRRGRKGVWVFIFTVWQHTDNLAEVWGNMETTQVLYM